MKRHNFRRPAAPPLKPGQTEYEFGIPIPGTILPPEQWAKTAIKRLDDGPMEWNTVFSNPGPVALDIGCGNGRFTIASAVARPDWNHVAIDFLPAVVRYGTRRANQRGLANCRFAVIDGWRMLHTCCSSQSLSEIHIYHPQPYSDPNQSHMRMLTPEFILRMHDCLVDGGKVFLQTDREAYWDYITAAMKSIFHWQTIDGDWPAGPEFRSRREILARKQGLPIFRGIATRKDDWPRDALNEIIAKLAMPVFAIE